MNYCLRPVGWFRCFGPVILALGISVAPAAQLPVFKAGVSTVPVQATVRGRDGKLITGLTRDEFRVSVDGRAVELTGFSNTPVPITGVLLIDVRRTMSEQFSFVQAVGRHLVDALAPGDRLRIGSFGEEVAISPHLTGDRPLLHRLLSDELWPGGGSSLWVALSQATSSFADETSARTLIVVSDGVANDAGYSAVRAEIENSGAMVYGLTRKGRGLGFLRTLAGDSGGGFVEISADRPLDALMADVAEQMRTRYLMAFTPPERDGRTHKIEVKVDRAGARVHATERFVAQKAPSQ